MKRPGRLFPRLVVLGVGALLVATCEETSTTAVSGVSDDVPDVGGPAFAISDASHEVGGFQSNPSFHFLFPLVDPRSVVFNGPADLDLFPEIEICLVDDMDADGRCTNIVQRFSRAPVGDESAIKVKPRLEMYLALWDAREIIDRGDVGQLYRANFFVGEQVLGFADIEVVRSLFGLVRDIYEQSETIQGDDDFAAIPAGLSILPLPFRIEDGALSPAAPASTVFLNFEGVTLLASNTTDDATGNVSALVESSTTVVPALSASALGDDGGLSRSEIISATVAKLEAIHAAYNVVFTTTRPASGDYNMLVFGGSCQSVTGLPGCDGIAVSDCEDVYPSNIGFVFPPGLRVEDLAVVAARQNAIALGLDPTDNPLDVMYPLLLETPPEQFASGNTLGGGCTAPGTFQDSDQAMLDALGSG